MKVLSFNAYYTPEFAASLFLEEDIAEGFAKAGLENEMYVPTPSRGVSDEVREEYKSRKEEFFFDNKLLFFIRHSKHLKSMFISNPTL